MAKTKNEIIDEIFSSVEGASAILSKEGPEALARLLQEAGQVAKSVEKDIIKEDKESDVSVFSKLILDLIESQATATEEIAALEKELLTRTKAEQTSAASVEALAARFADIERELKLTPARATTDDDAILTDVAALKWVKDAMAKQEQPEYDPMFPGMNVKPQERGGNHGD